MASQITMPKLSDTMKEGILVKWLKREGDPVSPGDVLAEVETDKATMELEVFESGVVRKLFGKEGEGIPVGAVVGILAASADEDISALLPSATPAPAAAAQAAAKPAPAVSPAPASPAATPAPAPTPVAAPAAPTPPPAPAAPAGRVLVTPVARRIAEEKGLDLGRVQGSGPGGRIVKRDVVDLRATPAPSATTSFASPVATGPEVQEVPLSNMRKIIGRRLAESKFTAPHFYVSMDVDMDRAVALREELKALDVKISFNDLVLKAVANALVAVPAMNSHFDGERLLRYRDVHLGFAVSFEGGLITPVIRHAHRKSLGEIAKESRDLIARAKLKKLAPEEYTGSTFTVSNLGMFGVSEFTAILNTPEVGILAVGGIRQEPVVKDGAVVPGNRLKLTVSVDHRAADGADGATLLSEIRKILENPSLLSL